MAPTATLVSFRLGGADGVAVDDISFRRVTQELAAEFRLDGGRVGVTPGLRNHHFRQRDRSLEAREALFRSAGIHTRETP